MSRARRIPGQLATGRDVVAVGLRRKPFGDLYHLLLTVSWKVLFAGAAVAYVLVNAVFAAGYLALGEGALEHARPGSFADAFWFSVETFATIGYGNIAPVTTGANLLVVVEAFVGLGAVAVFTGLVFAKFSRPTSRVVFSRVAVVTRYDGVPSLLVRMANERSNQIVEAHLTLSLVRDETTAEGVPVRRVHDLALRRPQNAFFALTWTAIHPITPESPLHGVDPEEFAASETNIVAVLVGFDESFSQTVHARHAWRASEVLFGYRFLDVLSNRGDGTRLIDYRRFHEVEPDPRAGDGAARSARIP